MTRGCDFLVGGALLAVGGCYPGLTFVEDVTYEVQVRDEQGHVVPEARVLVAQSGAWTGIRSVEGKSDTLGLCRLDTAWAEWWVSRGSTEPLRPWLALTVEKDAFEPYRMEFSREQFIQDGRRFRRGEAIVLKRKSQ